MPPSGYDDEVVDHKVGGVEGCYALMRAEVAGGKHPSLEAAVAHELKTLSLALQRDQFGDRPLVKADLEQMLAVYQNLKTSVDNGTYASYEEAMDRQPEELRKALTKLHVDDEGNVS
jgi:hypothetical protein